MDGVKVIYDQNAKQKQIQKDVEAVDVTFCHYQQIRGDVANTVCMEITETVFKGTLTLIMWVIWLH